MSDGSRWDWGRFGGPWRSLGGTQGVLGLPGEVWGYLKGVSGWVWEDFGDHSEGLWLPGGVFGVFLGHWKGLM